MSENKLPSGIGRVVGQRLRGRRLELKLTQERLVERLNLTFRQVQKYEKGVNRVSAGRPFEIACVLGVPVTYFYEGAADFVDPGNAPPAEDNDTRAHLINPETLDLIAAFQRIGDVSLRKSLLDTIRAAALASDLKQHD